MVESKNVKQFQGEWLTKPRTIIALIGASNPAGPYKRDIGMIEEREDNYGGHE